MARFYSLKISIIECPLSWQDFTLVSKKLTHFSTGLKLDARAHRIASLLALRALRLLNVASLLPPRVDLRVYKNMRERRKSERQRRSEGLKDDRAESYRYNGPSQALVPEDEDALEEQRWPGQVLHHGRRGHGASPSDAGSVPRARRQGDNGPRSPFLGQRPQLWHADAARVSPHARAVHSEHVGDGQPALVQTARVRDDGQSH